MRFVLLKIIRIICWILSVAGFGLGGCFLATGQYISAAVLAVIAVILAVYPVAYIVVSKKRKTDTKGIDDLSGDEFEYVCAQILKNHGFTRINLTPKSGDQGADILAEKDGVKFAFQCKCYSSNLDNTPVQEIFAGKCYYNCHVGVVITNSYFTSGAKDLAKSTGILLWDRDRLMEMM